MRTFIGELIFRFKDDASGKAQQAAKNVGGSMDRLEQAAKRLNSMPWGGRFTSQLDKLGLAAGDIEKLRVSWERLHQSIASRNLSKAAARTEIENFKVATLGHFASIQSASQQHFKDMERRARTFSTNLQTIMKPALVAMGGYTGAYAIAGGARAGITAASNEQRERARQHFAGLPASEQAQIEAQAGDLAVKYRTSQADAMEIMREARLAMPSANAAFSVAEEMIQAYKMLGLMFGPDQAISGLRAFNKAMDNININQDPDAYRTALDAYIRNQQITGKDMDPEAYAQAIKYSRTSGKVFGRDFFANWLPFIISESGGSDAGTQLRAAFDQLIVGRASKKSLAAQSQYGIRGDDDRLVEQNRFTENPIAWINDVMMPLLKKNGVNVDDGTELSRVLGELTNNRLSSDLLSRVLLSYEQYRRQVEMGGNAVGLVGAKDIDKLDPYSAFKGFKDAMSNLSGAVLPMEAISSGLITFADALNAVQKGWRDGDPVAKAGIAAGGAGVAFGAWKTASAIWGLITAGTNLNAAAVSLQAAAVSLGGAGGADMLGGGGGKKKGGLFGAGWFTPVTMGAAGITGVAALADAYKNYRRDHPEIQGRDDVKTAQNVKALREVLAAIVPDRDSEAVLAGQRAASGGGNPLQNAVDNATRLGGGPVVAEAKQVGQEIQDALSVTAKPTVDTSDLKAVLGLIGQIRNGLSGLGGAASAAAQRASQQAEAEIRRSFSDYGVRP